MRPPSGGEKKRREEEKVGGKELEAMEMKRRRKAIMQTGILYKAMVVKAEEV